MKEQKGITLIALVITIIVLLILAGVSIAMLTGENGILTKATSAKSTTTAAEQYEAVKLALAEIVANKLSGETSLAGTDGSTKVDGTISKANIEAIIERDNSNIKVSDLSLTDNASEKTVTFKTSNGSYSIDTSTAKITETTK
jgi:Tfp pilus assembly major pilin PilA